MERGDSSVLLQAIVLIAIYDSKMASDLSLPVLSAIKVGGGVSIVDPEYHIILNIYLVIDFSYVAHTKFSRKSTRSCQNDFRY